MCDNGIVLMKVKWGGIGGMSGREGQMMRVVH